MELELFELVFSVVFNILHSSDPPPPPSPPPTLHKGRLVDSFKIEGNEEGKSENFCQKLGGGVGVGKIGGVGGCLEIEGLPHCIEIFLEILRGAAQKKDLDLFIFPLLNWHCNSFNSVNNYNSCINYSGR